MPSWPALLDEFNRLPSVEEKTAWTEEQLNLFLDSIAQRRDSNVVVLAHGRRIGVDECENVGLRVERMEADQEFQDEILSVYHLLSIIFEQSAAVKIVRNHQGQSWVKSFEVGT